MTITIMAEEGPLTLGFDDLERYHGHAALAMLAITYRVQQAVFERLCPDAPPRREAISVISRPQHVALRDGVLPPEFFSLLGATDAADMQAGFVLRRRIAGDVLAHDTARLLVFA